MEKSEIIAWVAGVAGPLITGAAGFVARDLYGRLRRLEASASEDRARLDVQSQRLETLECAARDPSFDDRLRTLEKTVAGIDAKIDVIMSSGILNASRH